MNALKRLVVHVIRERDALSKQLDAWKHSRGWKFDGCDPPEVGNLPEAEWQDRERWSRDLEFPAPDSLSELIGKLWTHNGFTEFDNLDRDVVSAGMRLNLGAGVEIDLNDLRRARHAMVSAVCDMMTDNEPSTLFGVESVHQLNDVLSRLMRRVPAFDIAEKPEAPSTATPAKTEGDAKPKKKEPTVNARMIDTLGKRPEAKDWTVTQWQAHLGGRTGRATIHGTKTWQELEKMRTAAKTTRLDRDSFRDDHGKRKANLR